MPLTKRKFIAAVGAAGNCMFFLDSQRKHCQPKLEMAGEQKAKGTTAGFILRICAISPSGLAAETLFS